MQVPNRMQAWTCRRYGGPEVLALENVPVPVLKSDEVLIRVHATTVSSADSRIRALRLPRGFGNIGRLVLGFRGPRRPILGTEVSGVVAAVGSSVRTFGIGDPVIAFLDTRMGGHAAFAAIKETGLVTAKPDGLSFEVAASLCFGGMTARDYIRKSALVAGERLLVIGGAGTVGSAFVQLATQRGVQVTAVTSTANVARLRALGAESVIDYTQESFIHAGMRWDVIADTVAASSFASCLPVLNEGGRYLAIAGSLSDMLARPRGSRRSIAGPVKSRVEDLKEITRLAATGAFTPLIDSVHAFVAIRDAHIRTDSGRKQGSVVVRAGTG